MGLRFRTIDSGKNISNLSAKIVTLDQIEWFERDVPSRAKAVYLYTKSWMWKNAGRLSSTWPHISGDSFQKLADFSISTEKDLKKCDEKNLARSRIVFIRSDLFEEFILKFDSSLNAGHVLISGNSDIDFEKLPESLVAKDFKWFAQNSFILNDSRVNTIPIGIENISLGNHGRLQHLKECNEFIRDKILFGPMGDTHGSRRELLSSALKLQEIFYLPTKRLPPRQYVELSADFKYVFCPRGNGVDTHRFWESLYRGQTPIILESPWAKTLQGLGLPFICVPTLESLPALAAELDYRKSDFNPKDIEALWMPYWEKRINQN